MPTALWSALTSRAAGPVAAVVAIALALALAWSQIQLGAAKIKAADAGRDAAVARSAADGFERDLGTCRANVDELKAAVNAQNAAVDGLKAAGDARQALAVAAVDQARKSTAEAEQSAGAILAAKPSGPDRCAAADQLILETVR